LPEKEEEQKVIPKLKYSTMVPDAILSAFMQILFEKLSSAVVDHLQPSPSVHNMLDNLTATLLALHAFLDDAEAKQLGDSSVKVWLAKLKDVFYDVDDLLDDFYTRAIRSKAESKCPPKILWGKVHAQTPSSHWQGHLYGYKMKRKFRFIQQKLDQIAMERDALGLQMLSGTSRPEVAVRPESTSLVDSSMVFGREGDRDEIVRLLLSDNGSISSNVSVVPIVGMGGIGKTTLVKMVYNNSRVKDYFELRMWIYVSENFDERRLTKETLESIICDQSFVTTNMNMLQEALSGMLKGKRFLLVLDDVWNEDHEKWLSYKAALASGKKGSKIVVTTRNENVGRVMGGTPPYRLQQLSDEDCWELFKKCAFLDGDCSAQPRLEGIGKEMVKKLKGLPLASKALGSLLYSNLDEEEWKEILKSEIWELPPDKNNILPALTLSYKHLPSYLKQCFAFCSIFHKDYIFEREKLVQIWVAEGFVRSQGNKRLEDTGNSYFKELLSRSFFQPYNENYVMHDAMHDLARSISVDDCCQLGDSTRHTATRNIRHLSFPCENSGETHFERLYGYKGLRTLILLHGYRSSLTRIPGGLFKKLKTLRVLDLQCRRIKEIPDSIGNLKQLRLLDLSKTQIRELPISITELINLQTLRLSGCDFLHRLPGGMTDLINLHHLEASTQLICTITGIGKLTGLQELEEFAVSKSTGYKITELKNMAELRGHLCIRGLDNIIDVNEACEAKLSSKENLRVVHLVWEENREGNTNDEVVLEGLQPHFELKELIIKGYQSASFPAWLGYSSFTDLQLIRILNCTAKTLPSLGQLPFLQYLDIGGAKEVTCLGPEFTGTGNISGFPSLKELLLEDMPNLRNWSFENNAILFPRLIEIAIVNCPQLKKLPPLPSTLTTLWISEVGLTSLPELQNLSEPSSLISLKLNDCPDLRSLREGLFCNVLDALRTVTITNCEALVSLPEECFRHLTSLQTLHIYNCPFLVPWTALEGGLLPSSLKDIRLNSCSQFTRLVLNGLNHLENLNHFEIGDCLEIDQFPSGGLPATLSFLQICDCDDLQSFPQMCQIISLKTLIVSNCPEIMHFPEEGLPRELCELYVKNCPLLKHKCQVGGPDRIKIAHVKNVEIDGEVIESEW
jgi:Leucine-rich repeat (LRR) protein